MVAARLNRARSPRCATSAHRMPASARDRSRSISPMTHAIGSPEERARMCRLTWFLPRSIGFGTTIGMSMRRPFVRPCAATVDPNIMTNPLKACNSDVGVVPWDRQRFNIRIPNCGLVHDEQLAGGSDGCASFDTCLRARRRGIPSAPSIAGFRLHSRPTPAGSASMTLI